MFNFQKRLKGIDENRSYVNTRIAVRDRLLNQEFKDVEESVKNLPSCKLFLPTNLLHHMELTVSPTSGLYKGGQYKFSIDVPPEYNNVVRMRV